MPTHATDPRDASLGSAAKEVAEHASALVRLEIELAKLEVSRKVGSLGAGLGLGVGAVVVAAYMVGFLFATIAAGLATVMPTWLALLIVTLFLLLVTVSLGLFAVNRIKKGTPPVPEQAIAEAKLTSEALKSDGNSG
jgi:Putative Actinobacterial Holin-X, holin superfamily III